ncbi:MAG: rubrerythrin [Planctomycetota bacterium]|nr:MAG: rubrerythrin [Planctomycetota bacterium]REJ86644.1 MAG: rubrerythrin [Planctomycetota bacterium]REK28513.1 MAG: rubrerythrin [Planctomycetota bacterium]REK29147.1 MAG: rubrerythrin [Planctomycetota bacterium]
MLQTAYRMELETVTNYLANSVHLDGVEAEEVKRSLAGDVQEELGHATRLANRIKQLGGRIPGSLELNFDQESMRPPKDSTDVLSVVRGVVDAETSAIEHYRDVIKAAEEMSDAVTADLATQLLADEEEHRTQFEGFLAGWTTD